MCVYGNIVFTGTGNGEVYASFNYGNSWVSVSDGLVDSPILSLCVSGTYLFAGINAGGVWKRPLSEILRINEINSDGSFYIYPNPANNQILIETNKIYEKAIISIFDINGHKIFEQKIDGCKSIINIANFASGVYIIKICSNKQCILINKFVKE